MTSLKEARAMERDKRKKARLVKYAEMGVERAAKALDKLEEPKVIEEVKEAPKKSTKKKTTKKGGK